MLLVVIASLFGATTEGLIKKLSPLTLQQTIFSPHFMVLLLVVVPTEVLILRYLYRAGMPLSLLGILTNACLSLFLIVFGVAFFGETINVLQGIGIVVTIIGITMLYMG